MALILISTFWSITDIRLHKISNRSLIASIATFSVLLCFTDSQVNPITFATVLIFSPILLRWGIGAGDIKLLTVLSLFFIPFSWLALSNFLIVFSLLAALFLVNQLARSHSFAGAIPLAPAICGAVIWCAR